MRGHTVLLLHETLKQLNNNQKTFNIDLLTFLYTAPSNNNNALALGVTRNYIL
jgi:hypothetical protein